jgi:uncharacterized damage-inducible protein DinB
MNDTKLRENLVELLESGHAHTTAEVALKGVKPENRSARPAESVHSVWEELEHMRLAQEDILRYTLDPAWQSPPWPEGYWPAKVETVTDEMWRDSVEKFSSDLKEVVALIRDSSIDLTAEIPHGEGRTYLRQVMLVADHNAYHLGQIVQLRKLLGDWPKSD